MNLTNAVALTVGTLWDGRLKVFAQVEDGFMTKEKTSAQPGATWSNWTRFNAPSGTQNMPCAFQELGGGLSIFCNSLIEQTPAPGALPQPSLPSIVTQTQDKAGAYSAWSNFAAPAGTVLLAGTVLRRPALRQPSSSAAGPAQLVPADPTVGAGSGRGCFEHVHRP
jgi:hypothetical protein